MSKLIKPLFINGMYNKDGKRIRANYLKTVGEYPLWVVSGDPDKKYARNPQDNYYIYVQVGEYIFTKAETEYDIIQRAGFEKMVSELYGSIEKRNKFFEELYESKDYEEYNSLVKEQIAKEQAFIDEYGQKEEVQASYIKKEYIDKHIKNYLDARDNKSKFPDFIGALCLNELDKCQEIAKRLRAEQEEKERIKNIELQKQKAKEIEEKTQAEKKLLEEAENIFINGGIIKDGKTIIKLANKYNVTIPLRTKGWILNSLAELEIEVDKIISYSYKYWKNKNATGSQRIFDVLRNIRSDIVSANTYVN